MRPVLASAALLVSLSLPSAAQEFTVRVSVPGGGAQGDRASGALGATMSDDGRFVAFASDATNLVPGDTNGFPDAFLVDRQTGIVQRLSLSTTGQQANSGSGITERDVSVSGDGQRVAFCSDATNLVPGVTTVRHVFLADRPTNTLGAVDVGPTGLADRASLRCRISGDGRFVAFETGATNLIGNDTNGVADIYVSGPMTPPVRRVSVSSAGVQGPAGGQFPSISRDGSRVAFSSGSTNLVPGDTNFASDVFVHDLPTGQTTRVSVSSAGVQGNADSVFPWISAGGQHVVFLSSANNLVAGDTNAQVDVFVHDLSTGATTRVSVDSAGAQYFSGAGIVPYPILSGDGRFAAFSSAAAGFVAGDTNVQPDVFVHDRLHGITTRASVTASGGQALAPLGGTVGALPFLSFDHGLCAFTSDSGSLVPGDTNGFADVILRRVAPAALTLTGTMQVNQPLVFHFASTCDAGNAYVAALSLGNRPGIPVDARAAPLNPDLLFTLSLTNPAFFAGFTGSLDSAGSANATLVLPPQVLGVPFYAAFATLRPGAPSGIGSISNERRIIPLP